MGQRQRALLDLLGVEYGQVAALGFATEDDTQQPAVALGCVVAARHKNRLAAVVACARPPQLDLAAVQINVGQAVAGFAGA